MPSSCVAEGLNVHACHGTVMTTSFEAGPIPHALRALTRTKYVPGVAFAMSEVAVLFVSNTMMLLLPEVVPASTMCDSGEPEAASQLSVTIEPFFKTVRLPGAPGRLQGPGPTVTMTSFEAVLVPVGLRALTRTK